MAATVHCSVMQSNYTGAINYHWYIDHILKWGEKKKVKQNQQQKIIQQRDIEKEEVKGETIFSSKSSKISVIS